MSAYFGVLRQGPSPLEPDQQYGYTGLISSVGADGKGWADATAQVAHSIHDHGMVTADNSLCGDPALGFAKHLEIKYRLKGQERNKSISENESWSIGGASPHRFILTPNAGTDAMELTC